MFLVILSHDDSFLQINSAFCATALPICKILQCPGDFSIEALINILQMLMNQVTQQLSMSLSSLCRQGFGKEQEGDQLHAMQQIWGGREHKYFTLRVEIPFMASFHQKERS